MYQKIKIVSKKKLSQNQAHFKLKLTVRQVCQKTLFRSFFWRLWEAWPDSTHKLLAKHEKNIMFTCMTFFAQILKMCTWWFQNVYMAISKCVHGDFKILNMAFTKHGKNKKVNFTTKFHFGPCWCMVSYATEGAQRDWGCSTWLRALRATMGAPRDWGPCWCMVTVMQLWALYATEGALCD